MNAKNMRNVFRTPAKMQIKRAALLTFSFFLANLGVESIFNKVYSQDNKKKGAKTEQVSDTTAITAASLKQKYEAANPGSTLTYAATADIKDLSGGYLRFVDKKDGSTVRVITDDEATLVTDAGAKGKNISGVWIVTPDGKTFYAYRVTKASQMAPVSTQ